MRAIEQHGRLAAPGDQLHPSWPRAAANPAERCSPDRGDAGVAERVEDAPRNRRVRRLVCDPEDRPSARPHRCPDSRSRTGRRDRRLEWLHDVKRDSDASGTPADDRQVPARAAPVTAAVSPRLMICAFSVAIASIVGPENVHVIESDIGDRRNAALPDVCRVESAADAHLDHGYLDTDASEIKERGRRQHLELSRRSVSSSPACRPRRSLRSSSVVEIGNADRLPVDLDSLAIRDEMGLGRLSDPITRLTQRRADECLRAEPLPFVPPISTPRSRLFGSPKRASAGRAFAPGPRRMPKRPRDCEALKDRAVRVVAVVEHLD